MELDDILMRLIPYRLNAIDTLSVVLENDWRSGRSMQIFFDDQLVIEGNSNGYANPVIESGLIHCRALLEFMGLCSVKGELQSIGKRRSDDIGIESFSTETGALSKVSPPTAVANYAGDPAEAKSALLAVFHATHKGLAHFTCGFEVSVADENSIRIASRLIPALIVSNLYAPLGMDAPDFSVRHRPRE